MDSVIKVSLIIALIIFPYYLLVGDLAPHPEGPINKFRSYKKPDLGLRLLQTIDEKPLPGETGDINTLFKLKPKSLPDQPSPIVKVNLIVNIVFLGLPRGFVDFRIFQDNLLKEYIPPDLVKGIYGYGERPLVTVQYSYDYRILELEPELAASYALFIIQNHVVGRYPWQLPWEYLSDQAVDVWYVDALEAEEWLIDNLPPDVTDEGYTIVFIDTYNTNPSILKDYGAFYFYNASDVAMSSLDSSNFQSEAFVAFGGKDRLLFVDLSAGPKRFSLRPPELFKPIFQYDFRKVEGIRKFSEDLASYVNSAIVSRFTPSWLFYTPYYESFFVNLVIFNNDTSFDYASAINLRSVLKSMQSLMPNSIWEGSVKQLNLNDEPELLAILKLAYNRTWGYELGVRPTGMFDWGSVYDYLARNLERYSPPIPGRRVVPVFAFAGINGNGFPFLGVAPLDREKGEGQLVILNMPRIWVGADARRLVWFSLVPVPPPDRFNITGLAENHTWVLNPGDSIIYGRVVLTKYSYVELEIEVREGTADIYVVDRYNYQLWSQGLPFKPLVSKVNMSIGIHSLKFLPPRPDAYYALLVNPYDVASEGVVKVIQSVELWPVSWTGVAAHEIGHFVGINHPHTIFDPGMVTGITGVVNFFFWDQVWSVMGYLTSSPSFDRFDFDVVHRGLTLNLLNEHAKIVKTIMDDLDRLGFGEIPPNVADNLTLSYELRSKALALFSYASPNYEASFKGMIPAVEAAKAAKESVKLSLLDATYTVVDPNGFPLSGAILKVTLPNGTVVTLTSDERGKASLSLLPWGNYSYSVFWKGVKVHESSFREVKDIKRNFIAKVYSLRIDPRDVNGIRLKNFKIHVTWPNGTILTFNEPFYDPQAPGGVYMFWVEWQGSDVTGMVMVNLTRDFEGIVANVFSIKIPRIVDVDGNEFRALIEIMAPNGTTSSSLNRFVQAQAQGGLWTFTVRYQGVIVASLAIDLKDNYEEDLVVSVANLSIKVLDSSGKPLPRAFLEIKMVNGSVLSFYSDGEGMVNIGPSPLGFYTVTSLMWQGVDVKPPKEIKLNLAKGTTFSLIARVYSLSLKVVDAKGKPVEGAKLSITLANGTLIEPLTGSDGRASLGMNPAGTYRVVSVRWQGVDVTPPETLEIDLESDKVVEVMASIYVIVIEARDALGLALVGAEIKLDHPNGTTISEATDDKGLAVIPGLPGGFYSGTVTYLGQSSSFSGPISELAEETLRITIVFSERVMALLAALIVASSIAAVKLIRKKRS